MNVSKIGESIDIFYDKYNIELQHFYNTQNSLYILKIIEKLQFELEMSDEPIIIISTTLKILNELDNEIIRFNNQFQASQNNRWVELRNKITQLSKQLKVFCSLTLLENSLITLDNTLIDTIVSQVSCNPT